MSYAPAVFALLLLSSVPVLAQQADVQPESGTSANDSGTILLKMPLIAPRSCEGTIELTYHQRNTVARVTGTIENATCAASSGNFELTISIRTADGIPQTLDVTDSWQRSDAQDVSFTTDYEIGENVDLVRVQASRVRCECAEAPAE